MPAKTIDAYLAGEVALWLQRNCGDPLEFLGCHNLSGVTVPRGEKNPVYCRTGKNTFEIVRTWRGAPGLGSLTLTAYVSVLNLIAELPCPPNIYAMLSACGSDEDPTNYDFLFLYYGVDPTSEGMDMVSQGLDPGAQTPVTLSIPASFEVREKVKKLTSQTINISALTGDDIRDIAFCDSPECSQLCGDESVGCRVGYAVTEGHEGAAHILKTIDGGKTWTNTATPFTTATDDINAVDCDGDVVVVVNDVSAAYAYSHDAGTTWTQVTGLAAVPVDVFVLGATRIWMCGYQGYIWFSDDRAASFDVQDTGEATTQKLNQIAFANALTGYAVGNANAFVRTSDGGTTWEAVTGPATGANNDLYAVAAVPNSSIVFVGDEMGNIYRSVDNGDTWTTSFTATAFTAGGIQEIVTWDCNILGFIANDEDPYWYSTATVDGSFYRSIDGGATWVRQDIPANDGLFGLTQCETNKYWMVGVDAWLGKSAGLTVS